MHRLAQGDARVARAEDVWVALMPGAGEQDALVARAAEQGRAAAYAKGIANAPQALREAFQEAVRALAFARFNDLAQPLELARYRQHAEETRRIRLGDYINAGRLGELLIFADEAAIRKLLAAGFRTMTDKHRLIEPVQLKSKLMSMLLGLEKNLGAANFKSIAAAISGKEFDLFAELERLQDMETLVHWISNFLVCAAQETKKMMDMPPYMYNAIAYMHCNYMKKLTLQQVAEHVHLNPWYLSVQMKKHVGASFSEYLCRVRIDKAKALLRQSDLKIYQVAEMCGFQEASYFNAVFRRLEGVAPSEYLKQRAAEG